MDDAAFTSHHSGNGPPAKELIGPGRGEHRVLGGGFAQPINHDMSWSGPIFAAIHLIGGDQQIALGDGHIPFWPNP